MGNLGAAKDSAAGDKSEGTRGARKATSNAYDGLINKYAAQYHLSPQLVKSVMTQESHFDPGAVSPKGALGLMQVMPATGKWMAGRMGLKGFTVSQLTNPDTNIHIGCAYLAYLNGIARKRGAGTSGVLASYNGGPKYMKKKSKQTSRYAQQVLHRKTRI
jgi:soluble lytic murein transglycosylase